MNRYMKCTMKIHMQRNMYGSVPGIHPKIQPPICVIPFSWQSDFWWAVFSLNLLSLRYFPAACCCLVVPYPAFFVSVNPPVCAVFSLIPKACPAKANLIQNKKQRNKPRNSPTNSTHGTAQESENCQSQRKARTLQPTGEGSELTASSSNKLLCQLSRKHRLQWHLEI